MRKIISLLSLLSIISSNVLTFGTNINSKIQTNHINHNINLSNKNNNDISTGFFLYEPNIKVNSLDDNPLINSGLSLQEQQYCDFVFLKSLYADADNDKSKTTISIDYSFSTLITYDNKYDAKDIVQDQRDFKVIQNYKDAYGHIGIEEGQSLLNQYLNNGLLSFNKDGYIPSRTTYFNYLLTNNKNNQNVKQTVLTNNYDQNNLFDMSDYLSINLHWYGINCNIGYKIADFAIYGIINAAIQEAFIYLGISIYASIKMLEEVIHHFVESAVTKVLEITAKFTVELDPEAPEVSAAIEIISGIVTELLCYKIDEQLDELVDKSVNLLDDLNNVIENKLLSLEGKQKLSIEVDINWIWIGSTIKINLADNEPVVTENTLTPAQVNPIIPDSNLLIGNTEDFITIFDDNAWTEIYNRILDDHDPVDYINNITIKNPNINLTNNDWSQILHSLIKFSGDSTAKSGYSLLMHIKKINNSFQVVYTNLNNDGTTSMPYADNEEHAKELFSGDLKQNNLILTNYQFSSLMSAYNYDQHNWTEIKNKNHPSETNADDYFYDNSINNRFWIDNKITKEQILIEIKKFNQAFYIPNSLQDDKAKKVFTFSQFVQISSNQEDVLNIPSNIGIDGVK